MAIEIVSADQLSFSTQAAVFSEAFRGYVAGSLELDAAGLARFLCAQGADVCYSCFALTADAPCGFAYVSRTGKVTRICGMGVLPAIRRSGVARKLLDHVIAEAKHRGDGAVLLEVIEQNPAAHTLYVQAGFHSIAHLLGWRRVGQAMLAETSLPGNALHEISLARASQLPSLFEFPDIPWQISRHAVAKLFSAQAFSCGEAVIVIGDPEITGPIRMHALSITSSPAANQWLLIRQALAAVLQLFFGREFFAPAVFPDVFGHEVFAPLGFTQEPLSQFLMRYDLDTSGQAEGLP